MYGIILLIALSWSVPQDTILPSGRAKFNPTTLECYAIYDSGVLYIVGVDIGLNIRNVMNLLSPYKVSRYQVDAHAKDAVVKEAYAYVADGYAGLFILDLSDITNPMLVRQYDTPGYAYSLVATGLCHLYILVADGYGGVQIYRYATENVFRNAMVDDGNEFDLNFISPMQFNVRFVVPFGEMAKLQLFDVSGREVWSGNFGPGAHRVQQNMPSGVYLLNLTDDAFSIMGKTVGCKN